MTPANFTGLLLAGLALCASLGPSLLPRHWGYQAVVSGMVVAVSYGLGVLVSHLWRSVTDWEPPARLKHAAWRTLSIVGPVAVLIAWWFGVRSQRRLHGMMGMEVPSAWWYLVAVLLAVVIAAVLVMVARGIRLIARRISRTLARWLPPRLAGILGGILVALLVIGLLDGFVVDRFFDAADETFRVTDRVIPDDAIQPESTLRSGGPESLVRWEDLGSKGRTFVAGGPTLGELAEFHSKEVTEPIRVYAGLASAETIEDRVALAVSELVRTGGFQRSVLCVVTATGTGWVDPEAVAALEYVWAGDTATVSVQYSYLPSWISFMVDSGRAREAGSELFDSVYHIWEQLPEDERPLLLVFGESLGADGAEAAFSGLADIRNRTDGVVWAGPPNFSELWTSFTAERDPGSPERLPVYQGGHTVRFASEPSDLVLKPGEKWNRPRVLYLQYPSDPVVWWTPRIALRQPDWLVEPRGVDVLDEMRWYPLVTFLQLTADMANSIQVPPGHGHNYAAFFADAWAAVAAPEDWTAADTARLREILTAQAAAAARSKLTS